MMTDPLDPDSKPADEGAASPAESTPDSPAAADPQPDPQPAREPVTQQAPASPTSKPGPLFFPAVGQGELTEKDEKLWAMMGHLLSLTGPPTGGFGYVIGPLIPYFLKKGQSPFVDEHNTETLNFSILTVIIVWGSAALGLASCFLWLVTAGMAVLNFIFCIQGAIAAKNGESYRYPFNLRLIKTRR